MTPEMRARQQGLVQWCVCPDDKTPGDKISPRCTQHQLVLTMLNAALAEERERVDKLTSALTAILTAYVAVTHFMPGALPNHDHKQDCPLCPAVHRANEVLAAIRALPC